MKVWIESQVGLHALHDADRAALPHDARVLDQALSVEAEHRIDEQPTDGTKQFAVVSQSRAQLERHGEHELPQRHARKNVLQQVQSGLCHSSAETRRTEAASLTRECNERFVRTALARECREASTQQAAVDVALELGSHELRQWRAGEALLGGRVQRVQVLAHDAVERAELGMPPLVRVAAPTARAERSRARARAADGTEYSR